MERAKAAGRETLRTGGKIVTYIAERKTTDDVSAGDILSHHVTESGQNMISKLRGRVLKRAWQAVGGKKSGPRGPKLKRAL